MAQQEENAMGLQRRTAVRSILAGLPTLGGMLLVSNCVATGDEELGGTEDGEELSTAESGLRSAQLASCTLAKRLAIGHYWDDVNGNCTATLVRDNVILLATHCFTGEPVPSYSTRNLADAPYLPANPVWSVHVDNTCNQIQQSYAIEKYITFGSELHDIAIARLSMPVPASVVPSPYAIAVQEPAHRNRVVVGIYGRGCTSIWSFPQPPRELRYAEYEYSSSAGWGQEGAPWSWNSRRSEGPNLNPSETSGGQWDPFGNLCGGDSGGPVVIARSDEIIKVNSHRVSSRNGLNYVNDDHFADVVQLHWDLRLGTGRGLNDVINALSANDMVRINAIMDRYDRHQRGTNRGCHCRSDGTMSPACEVSIVNPSFEEPVVPHPWRRFTSVVTNKVLPGWVGTVDVHRDLVAFDGNVQVVDLNHDAASTLEQTVTVARGERYVLEFDLGMNFHCGGSAAQVRVEAGNSAEIFNATPTSAHTLFAVQAPRTSNTMTLRFVSLTTGTSCGPTIDSIKLTRQARCGRR